MNLNQFFGKAEEIVSGITEDLRFSKAERQSKRYFSRLKRDDFEEMSFPELQSFASLYEQQNLTTGTLGRLLDYVLIGSDVRKLKLANEVFYDRFAQRVPVSA